MEASCSNGIGAEIDWLSPTKGAAEIVDVAAEIASSAHEVMAATEPEPNQQTLEHDKLVKSVRRKLLNVQDAVNRPNKVSPAVYEVGTLISFFITVL